MASKDIQEEIKNLEQEVTKQRLQNEIIKEKTLKINLQKNRLKVGILSVIVFVGLMYSTFTLFSIFSLDPTFSASISLIVSAFSAYLIILTTGLIKEFTIKSGVLELSTKLSEEVQKTREDIKETKKTLDDKIINLSQTINNKQEIDQNMMNMLNNHINSNSEQQVKVEIINEKVDKIKSSIGEMHSEIHKEIRNIMQKTGIDISKLPPTNPIRKARRRRRVVRKGGIR